MAAQHHQRNLASTGYRVVRHALASSSPALLTADQVLQGGPAVYVGGNVTGGGRWSRRRRGDHNGRRHGGGPRYSLIAPRPALLIGGAAPLTISNVADRAPPPSAL